jgi:hypothetical protein
MKTVKWHGTMTMMVSIPMLKITIFRDHTPCSLVEIYLPYEETYSAAPNIKPKKQPARIMQGRLLCGRLPDYTASPPEPWP